MIGPPGSGKTMLAKRLSSILPPLTLHEALETTKIHSVAGNLEAGSHLISKRLWRTKHHTISDVILLLNEVYQFCTFFTFLIFNIVDCVEKGKVR